MSSPRAACVFDDDSFSASGVVWSSLTFSEIFLLFLTLYCAWAFVGGVKKFWELLSQQMLKSSSLENHVNAKISSLLLKTTRIAHRKCLKEVRYEIRL
mgnify:CR=1 FL=1